MHPTLAALEERLQLVIKQVSAALPNDEPLSIAHGNWSFPGLTRSELIEEAQSIIDIIHIQATDDLGENAEHLSDYDRRLTFLSQSTIPNMWNNANAGVLAYSFTLRGLRKLLLSAIGDPSAVNAVAQLKKTTRQIRGLEAQITALTPRARDISGMVEGIVSAYSAADQLPADLQSLSEAREKMDVLVTEAARDQGRIIDLREQAETLDSQLRSISDEAKTVLTLCESAYSASTSVGLAAAFSERSTALAKSMWIWVAGLVLALAAGSYFGSNQLRSLSELLRNPDVSHGVATLNVMLSVLSVGAPIWFAWLATKQVGQRFRLAEDYAFKASISRAYEGFRREAARFDEDMERRLLSSALMRLDELPLRLVEPETHGSPWQELAASDAIRKALTAVPGFAEQVKDLAADALKGVASISRRSIQKSDG